MTASALPGRPVDAQGRPLPADIRGGPPPAEIRGRLLPALLALLVLVPLGFLFVQLYRSIDADRSFARSERVGVEYLLALGQVTIALNEAQAAAVAGAAVSHQPLTAALDATSAVDQRAGGQLRTTERWTALRAAIEALPGPRDAVGSYAAFAEASDLLLALYGVVRANSDLIRDPDADVYYLEDGAAEELPEALVMAGRLTDLSLLASSRPASELAATVSELAIARTKVASPVGDLAVDLQRAVDATKSKSLSGNLLSRLDRFRRDVDALGPATAFTDQRRLTVDAARANAARADLQTAASELSTTLLHELDGLIATRADSLNAQRWRAIGTMVLAVLLALVPVSVALLGRRRRIRAFQRTGAHLAGAHLAGRAAFRPSEPVSAAGYADPAGYSGFAGPAELGEVASTRRERSGAR